MRRVVITGVGLVTPLGSNKDKTWENILNNKCGIDQITAFDTTNYKTKLAAEVKDFKQEYFSDRDLKFNDRFVKFARVAAKEAILDSKIEITDENKSKIGILVSSGIGGIKTIEETEDKLIEQGPSKISPFFIPMSLINLAAGHIAIDNNLHGSSFSIVSACAAGANSIGEAFLKIKDGYLDACICGASEATITPLCVGGFEAMKALCTSTDKNCASIPFDTNRQGFVMGEGAGMLFIEEYEHAKKRNANIYCEIVGYGTSTDAYHITKPDESGKYVVDAMKMAIDMAKIKPSDVTYINAHGTSTYFNELTEGRAIETLFGNKPYVSSTKSNIGHLLGASGSVEAILCALMIKNKVVLPTINTKDTSNFKLNIPLNKTINEQINYAISNNLGFGGHNVSLLFKKI